VGASVQGARHGEHELINGNLERHAVIPYAMIRATHGTYWCGQRTAAGVFKCFAWRQKGLLTHHAQATHFLRVLPAICDDPVAADQLGRVLALVRNTHRVSKDKLLFIWL